MMSFPFESLARKQYNKTPDPSNTPSMMICEVDNH